MSSTPTTYTTKDSPHFLAEPNSKTITFRSSDGTLFHIEKLYAMAGSGVWRDRIEIGGKAAEAIAGGGEVVDLTEPTDLISVLLHYVVPELSPYTTKFTQNYPTIINCNLIWINLYCFCCYYPSSS